MLGIGGVEFGDRAEEAVDLHEHSCLIDGGDVHAGNDRLAVNADFPQIAVTQIVSVDSGCSMIARGGSLLASCQDHLFQVIDRASRMQRIDKQNVRGT